MKEKILLHTCCAPCICYVQSVLQKTYKVKAFYYNPNIHPEEEYYKRLYELERYVEAENIQLAVGHYEPERWEKLIAEFKDLGERSERCWKCYEIRIDESFQFAKKNNIKHVTTALSISPHKNANKINEIGTTLAEKYGINFLEADFKKNDGFKKSIQLSKEYGFYRQDYCGCKYSFIERQQRILQNRR